MTPKPVEHWVPKDNKRIGELSVDQFLEGLKRMEEKHIYAIENGHQY